MRVFLLVVVIAFVVIASNSSAQEDVKPITVSVTLTAKQVKAFRLVLGADVNIERKAQDWMNTWAAQYEHRASEVEDRQISQALADAPVSVKEEVRKLLKISTKK